MRINILVITLLSSLLLTGTQGIAGTKFYKEKQKLTTEKRVAACPGCLSPEKEKKAKLS